jgi:hypothetical protein
MQKLIKSGLVITMLLAVAASATGAFFTSNVTAASNQIVAGTLRLGIDSTQVHTTGPNTWGFPYAYTVVEDVNGVSTQYANLETWMNAAPGSYVAYSHPIGDGADVLADGNHSYWVSFRNAGTIPMKVKGNVTGGSWSMNPAVAATAACTGFNPNATPTVAVRNVHFYASNNCEGHEECENIYYGLLTGPWTNASIPAFDVAGAPITGSVYASTGVGAGTNAGTPVQLNGQQFIVARVDVNFDNSAVPAAQQNSYQGATFTYSLNGSAYQMTDAAW